MTVIAHPLDAIAGSPEYAAGDERVTRSALYGAMPGRPLGARSGLRPGTPPVLTVTGSTWSIGRCSGVIDPGITAVSGPYDWAVVSTESGDVNPSQTNPRVDTVYLRVKDNAVDVSGQATAVVEYVAGTPASSPVPSTTMADGTTSIAQAFVFGYINVPATGSGAPAAQQNRRFTSAAGGLLICQNSADYPTSSSSLAGSALVDLALGELFIHDGTGWKKRSTKPELSDDFVTVNLNGSGNGTVAFDDPFVSPPTVLICPAGNGGGFSSAIVGSVTTTGFTFTARNNLGATMNGSTVAITYIAAGNLA